MIVAEVKLRLGTTTTGILPLSFGGQGIALILLLAQPFAECVSVIPTHANHRMFVALLEAGIAPVDFRIAFPGPVRNAPSSSTIFGLGAIVAFPHELFELSNRHIVGCDLNRFSQGDLMQRGLMAF